jgi:hypothetical protein
MLIRLDLVGDSDAERIELPANRIERKICGLSAILDHAAQSTECPGAGPLGG